MKSQKWSDMALDAYKDTGQQLKAVGYRPLREIKDPDGNSVLTFWAGADGAVIQQTWTDTGDVQLYRTVTEIEIEKMISAKKAS